MKSDTLYTIHIRECIDRIQLYLTGIDQNQFMASSLIQDAVMRNLQVLAECILIGSDNTGSTRGERLYSLVNRLYGVQQLSP